jgi:hypothetical protein
MRICIFHFVDQVLNCCIGEGASDRQGCEYVPTYDSCMMHGRFLAACAHLCGLLSTLLNKLLSRLSEALRHTQLTYP